VALIPTFLAGFALAVWLYLFFARGNFWLVREDSVVPQSLEHWPRVVAIVPARNEAETIAAALTSLVKQDYPGEFSIVVVDDQSEDATAELARRVVKEFGARQVTIVRATDRPEGWTGKLWALQEGIQTTTRERPDFLWFTDADIEHAPDTLRRLVFRAEKEGLGLASLFVLLRAKTFEERLLIPPFLYFFLLLYPPRWIANSKKQTAGAAGGCILIRRPALERIGGLETIRDQVIDDCVLARAVKKSGQKIWMGLTRRSVSLRSYETFAEIRDMIARTAFTQLGYSTTQLIGALAALFATYWLAWLVFFTARGTAWGMTDLAIAMMLTTFVMSVRHYRLNPAWALTLPVAVIFYGYATCVSAIRYWAGHGGQWKGRVQAPRAG